MTELSKWIGPLLILLAAAACARPDNDAPHLIDARETPSEAVLASPIPVTSTLPELISTPTPNPQPVHMVNLLEGQPLPKCPITPPFEPMDDKNAVINKSPGPKIAWIRRFGADTYELASDVGVDSEGNVLVSGFVEPHLSFPSRNPPDILIPSDRSSVRKYDNDGDELWARQLRPYAAFGLRTTKSDASYVVGYTSDTSGFIRRYDKDGHSLWERTLGNREEPWVAQEVSADNNGNAYVVGQIRTAKEKDSFIAKFDPGGAGVWTLQFGFRGVGTDLAGAVANDASDQLYVAGWIGDVLPGQAHAGCADGFLRKFLPDGTELWARQFGTAENDLPADVWVDTEGHAYVVGSRKHVALGLTDAFVYKFDADGTMLWSRAFDIPPSPRVTKDEHGNTSIATMMTTANGVAVDLTGNVYAVGQMRTPFRPGEVGNTDAFVRKFDRDGEAVWTYQFGTTGDDIAHDIWVDRVGSLYVVGIAGGQLPGQIGTNDRGGFVMKLTHQ